MPVGAGSAGPEGEGATNVSSNKPNAAARPVSSPSDPEVREQKGLRVNFVINNKNLIMYTLWRMSGGWFPAGANKEDLVAFQSFARDVSPRDYDFIVGRLPQKKFRASGGTPKGVDSFLSQIEQSSEFGKLDKIRKQTEEYLEVVKAQWQRNYPITSQAIQELTGLDLNKQVTVNVIHPSLNTGRNMGNDTIIWGHHEEWNNYSTVYLWHEILHSYFDSTELSHALIHLVADNELRVRLNEGEPYPLFGSHAFERHENLVPLMYELLPHWQTYLAEAPEGGKRDILAFEEKLRAMPVFKKQPEKQPETKIIE